MLNKNVSELLNHQINEEFFSAYLYLHFSNFYTETGLNGFAGWFQVQAQEERDHAMLFLQYLRNCNESVTLEPIRKPDFSFKQPVDPLQASLAHEQHVTRLIYNIYDAANTAKDFRTMRFLDWFITEQGEEEASAEDLIQKLTLFGTDSKGLYLLNQELGSRTYAPPTLTLF